MVQMEAHIDYEDVIIHFYRRTLPSNFVISANSMNFHFYFHDFFILFLFQKIFIKVRIDLNIYRLLKVPEDVRIIVEDFFKTRLPLDTPSKIKTVTREPSEKELNDYSSVLRNELDGFVMGKSFHRVTITYSHELIECIVEITQKNKSIPIDKSSIKKGDLTTAALLAELGDKLREQVAQWVYIQRGLRLFDGPRIYIYKTPRLIDWTRTQAIIDAGDIIGEIISLQ